eukprot:Ihof_evm6s187 gene=Ihof_evmTU6s187
MNRPAMSSRAASKKAAPAAPSSVGEGMSVSKRLQQELMSLMMSGDQSISAFPIGDNLLHWRGTIKGPAGTVYEGLSYRMLLDFPNNYPFSSPHVRFETSCYHPNVSEMDGEICLDILKDKWSALYDVRTILLSIQSLLGEPNNDSPLNPHAAQLWENKE